MIVSVLVGQLLEVIFSVLIGWLSVENDCQLFWLADWWRWWLVFWLANCWKWLSVFWLGLWCKWLSVFWLADCWKWLLVFWLADCWNWLSVIWLTDCQLPFHSGICFLGRIISANPSHINFYVAFSCVVDILSNLGSKNQVLAVTNNNINNKLWVVSEFSNCSFNPLSLFKFTSC